MCSLSTRVREPVEDLLSANRAFREEDLSHGSSLENDSGMEGELALVDSGAVCLFRQQQKGQAW